MNRPVQMTSWNDESGVATRLMPIPSRNCAPMLARRSSQCRASYSGAVPLNPLLTIHAANSAYPTPEWRWAKKRSGAMSISDLPTLSVLRTKMLWHGERQRVLSENVANSDTPNFRPRDLVEPKFDSTGTPGSIGSLAMTRTSGNHIAPSGGVETFEQNGKVGFETRPAGNAVNLED